jgi:hypothetical protein
MALPLVFDCPTTNVAVMARVELGRLSREKATELSFELACPCGEHHVLPLVGARFFGEHFDKKPPRRGKENA